MRHKIVILVFLVLLLLGCNMLVDAVPGDQLPTEIAPAEPDAQSPEPTPTPPPTMTPTPGPPTPTPYFLQSFSTCPPQYATDQNGECCPYDYVVDSNGFCSPSRVLDGVAEPPTPRHGLIIVLFLPLIIFGIPWMIMEFFVVRWVQPKSDDVAQVLIKAQDGLFIEANLSMTARRDLSLASSRMTWNRVIELVEKTVEQELIHEALNFATMEDLERNLKAIVESFKELPIVQELERDFGLQVMRFNVEIRYPQETMDAINRKAEASAGGTAYLAYAAAAHLDPDSRECRELYRVFQETSGQVDAARNLGGGITSIAKMLENNNKEEKER